MKKKIWIPIVVSVILLAALFIPLPVAPYRDGGTREYVAVTYKIVVWNRNVSRSYDNEAGQRVEMPIGAYHRTAIYWFADSRKTIDELWEMEKADHDINDYLLPEG